MLTNATLRRIDRRTGANAVGVPVYTQGGALAIQCSLQQVNSQQRITLGAVIKDAESVAYVPISGLVAASEQGLSIGDRVRIQLDTVGGFAPDLFVGEVVRPSSWIQSTLSHQELFLKAV